MEGYTKEQIEVAHCKIQQLIQIVNNLEQTFKGRHFTLDGHLVGSIGEVLASYHYGIKLYEASVAIHDGEAPDGRKVQIKITQTDTIIISEQPDYLIILYLNRRTGEVFEIYNGPGEIPFMRSYEYTKHNNRYMSVSMLCEEDTKVKPFERIPAVQDIAKFRMQIHKENTRRNHLGSFNNYAKKSIEVGYINKNNQENCGITGKEGTHVGQKLYNMKCQLCGYVYEANGCDVWLRKCPICQD
jgi:hypothetical protein